MNALPGMTQEDIRRIEHTLFFEQPELRSRLIRFAMLIIFASVIASGGLISDSVAAIVGAMIIAPLMTPIMGLVVALIIGSGSRALRCLVIVVAGVVLALLIGWLFATLMPFGWNPTTSEQIVSRTSPMLLDLVIALASGAQAPMPSAGPMLPTRSQAWRLRFRSFPRSIRLASCLPMVTMTLPRAPFSFS